MIDCKTYATQAAARGGITVAEGTWTRPTYRDVGGGRHVLHASLPPQRLSEPRELVNGRWVVVADHPSMKGERIAEADIKDKDLPAQAQAAPKGGK